ncbi:aldehyde dehydrogenase family protein [Amycolatopsis anabasis]|uniref:aldehyde dehydrogenase family protein n=1 Tax=Amycolatopsis anabasis TaxID=1840409 RepID=UPI00131AD257|nr:aldehyde dehydrogenase family protein [Amycolatopsis anabasis]
MNAIVTINPATGAELAEHPVTSEPELSTVLDRAIGRVGAGDRAAWLRALAARLRAGAPEFALLITTEMGKPLDQARAELEKCAKACEYYADRCAELTAPQPVDVAPDTGFVRALPLGVVLAIMPWNYPFWQVFRSMIPALAVGNSVVLKHADNVTGSARTVQALFDEVCEPGVLTAVILPPERIGPLIDDPRIAAVAFTGSNRVGAIVGARAGAAVKKTVLELGGSDPFIVLADADVEAAARAAIRSRFLNVGQSCIAAKRLIVDGSVRDEFVDAAVAELGKLVVGDPAAPGTDLGPMARIDLRDELRRRLDDTLAAGARLLAGGDPDDRPGAWFTPTLVEVPDPDNPACTEETFGPLGAVLEADGEDMAIALANASKYGLSCSIWTRDEDRARALATRIAAGSVFVNRISESDPRLPVGGVKASGHGRELGVHGALEFANIQAVRLSTKEQA